MARGAADLPGLGRYAGCPVPTSKGIVDGDRARRSEAAAGSAALLAGYRRYFARHHPEPRA
ncbi:MAG TPA: hypothetical protein VN231_05945 [Allosphingosinicella sp.]|nr:hypothetical protein [Allosphingosinicella sp.]